MLLEMTGSERGSRPDTYSNRPPGIIVLSLVAGSTLILGGVAYGWPSSIFGRLTDPDKLLWGGCCVLVLLPALAIWAIKSLHVLGQDRRWSWWIAPVPLIAVSTLGLFLLSPPPEPPTHDDGNYHSGY